MRSIGLLLLALVALSSHAQAQYSSGYSSSQSDSTSNTNSGTVTAKDVLRVATSQVIRLTTNRISSFLAPRPQVATSDSPPADSKLSLAGNGQAGVLQSGLSAGDAAQKAGVWMSGSWSRTSNSLSSTKYDGSLFTGIIGADYWVSSGLLVGTSLSFDHTDLVTKFNQGHLAADGYSITPYAAYKLSDNFSVSVLAGYTWVGNSADRSNGAVKSSYDSHRLIGALSADYYYVTTTWDLNAHGGYRYARESASAFFESDGTAVASRRTNLGDLTAGGRAGYFIGKFEPYAGVDYLYDTTLTKTVVGAGDAPPANDRNEVVLTFGTTYYLNDRVQGGLEVSNSFFKSNYYDTSVVLNFRAAF